MAKFLPEIVQTLKIFNQRPIFVKLHSILLKKDEETGFLYLEISLIQVGYISGRFELNIEAIRKFELFRFNESWINYRRTSGAFAVKCQGDRLYSFRLRSLHRGANYIILTKEGMKEGIYDDDLLKFLLTLKPEKLSRISSCSN